MDRERLATRACFGRNSLDQKGTRLSPYVGHKALLSIRAINSVGLILAITGGGPVRATNTLSFLLYQEAWKFGDFGRGAALAVIMFVLNLGLTLFYLRMINLEV